jgi:hypothetical protein
MSAVLKFGLNLIINNNNNNKHVEISTINNKTSIQHSPFSESETIVVSYQTPHYLGLNSKVS